DREAVDRGYHRFGYFSDQAVQPLDLEQAGSARPVVAALRALLLVAAGAERALAGARQADHADVRARPRAREQVDQLVDRARPERVHPLLPVDRDPGEAVLDVIPRVGQLHRGSFARGGLSHFARTR